jgi:hypothetical protein
MLPDPRQVSFSPNTVVSMMTITPEISKEPTLDDLEFDEE